MGEHGQIDDGAEEERAGEGLRGPAAPQPFFTGITVLASGEQSSSARNDGNMAWYLTLDHRLRLYLLLRTPLDPRLSARRRSLDHPEGSLDLGAGAAVSGRG